MNEKENMELAGMPPYFLHRGVEAQDAGSQFHFQGLSELFRSYSIPNPSFAYPVSAKAASPPSFSPHEVNAGGFTNGVSFRNEEPMKRKRGRPRKRRPEEATAMVPFSMSSPPSVSATSAGPSGSISASVRMKRGRGRPRGSGGKQQLASLGGWTTGSAGVGFTPHVITVSEGEDIVSKIMSFAQQGPRWVCVLSASGVVSTVTFHLPSSTTGGMLTYKDGQYEIMRMSGSYFPSVETGSGTPTGSISTSLSTETFSMIGGLVADKLIAASPVQIILGSFLWKGKEGKGRVGSSDDSKRSDEAPGNELRASPNIDINLTSS